MVSWSTVRPVLLALFSDIAVDQIKSPGKVHLPLETPKWNAAWKDRSLPFIHPIQKVALYLKITSSVGVGWDENDYVVMDTGVAAGKAATGRTNVFQVVSGQRRFTLNAQAWVLAEEDGFFAHSVLDRVRTRSDMESSRARLLAVNVDLTDCSAIRDMTATHEKRAFNIASCDFTMNAAINDVDPIPTGWIERVILTSHEQDAPGHDVPDSLRTIEEVLPPFP